MADTFFIEGLNTLPEQVQINKDNIKTNTDNIQRLVDLSDTYHEQIQALDTKVATNTAHIATNITNIDNLAKNVYDNGTISFYLDSNRFYFKDEGSNQLCYLCHESTNAWRFKTQYFTIDGYVIITEYLRVKAPINVNALAINDSIQITLISNSNTNNNHSLLTGKAINDNFLTKADASTTYATKTELSNANKRIDALDTGTFDVDLTTAGLAKIKANVTIGTSITLTKDTDFSQYLDYTGYKTVIFTLYIDNNEEYFISTDIKLDVGDTADVYGDNDQNYTWLTGIGVIKLGPNISGSNYLCYISYSQGYTSPLVITPIQKLA